MVAPGRAPREVEGEGFRVTVYVVGVDPGAEHTGIVVVCAGERTGDLTLLNHRTVERGTVGGLLPIPDSYFADVQTAIRNLILPAAEKGLITRLVVGVEVVHPPVFAPKSNLGIIDPGPLIAAAEVAGYTLAHWRDRAEAGYQVEPGGNGHGPYVSYPDELVTPQERRGDWQRRQAGDGAMRHVRSAWDVARRTEQQDRPHRRQG